MASQTWTTPGTVDWTVPTGVSEVVVECWGAQGGGVSGVDSYGGAGGYVKGTLTVTAGETLRLTIPAQGSNEEGGAAADVRQGGTALSDRVAVGAGGGGGGRGRNDNGSYRPSSGGDGGADTGADGSGSSSTSTDPGGGGGTQSAGGDGGDGGHTNGSSGSFGSGGISRSGSVAWGTWKSGGGGDGWYGGGSGGLSPDGADSYVAGGGGGGSNYVGTLSATSTLRGVREGDGQVRLTWADNTAPNAPNITAPSSGQTIDRTSTFRVQWDFDDPNTGDSQSQYEIELREQGTTSLLVDETVETPNGYHDVAGGTITSDGSFELRVRTWDQAGAAGSWSSWLGFDAVEPPAGPTITDPTAGQTISTETYEVTWSAAEQDDYQLRVVDDDGTGSPDTTDVVYDTGTVSSGSARSLLVPFDTNNVDRHIQLRVRRSGLWSPWSSVDVAVSYTPPATPSVTVDDTAVDGALAVQASHPEPGTGEPSVTSVDIWRREADDTGDGIRVAEGLAPTALFTDWAVASSVEYAYRVRAHADNGTSAWSAWSETPDTIDAIYGGAYQ